MPPAAGCQGAQNQRWPTDSDGALPLQRLTNGGGLCSRVASTPGLKTGWVPHTTAAGTVLEWSCVAVELGRSEELLERAASASQPWVPHAAHSLASLSVAHSSQPRFLSGAGLEPCFWTAHRAYALMALLKPVWGCLCCVHVCGQTLRAPRAAVSEGWLSRGSTPGCEATALW